MTVYISICIYIQGTLDQQNGGAKNNTPKPSRCRGIEQHMGSINMRVYIYTHTT